MYVYVYVWYVYVCFAYTKTKFCAIYQDKYGLKLWSSSIIIFAMLIINTVECPSYPTTS